MSTLGSNETHPRVMRIRGRESLRLQQWEIDVLLDRAARDDADLVGTDRIVDFRPGQFLVTVLGSGSTGHRLVLGSGLWGCCLAEVWTM